LGTRVALVKLPGEARMRALVTSQVGIVLLAAASQGCSVVGLGVGAAIPRYEDLRPATFEHVSPGDELRVTTEDGRTSEGKFVGASTERAILSTDKGTRTLENAHVAGVERRIGSQAGAGFGLGFVLDVTMIGMGAIALHGQKPQFGTR
jgi:hypothetical protein